MARLSRLVWSLTLCFLAGNAFAQEVRKIGVVLPLSGGAASSGETIRNSIQLAIKQFGLDSRLQFIFEDDAMQPKNTVTAVNKLIAHHAIDGLVVFGTNTSLAVTHIAEERKLPRYRSLVARV